MQRREGFFLEKTQVPRNTVPLRDGLPSSSAERHNERRFQDTASPRTPKQWHIKMKAKKTITALPSMAGRLSVGGRREIDNHLDRTFFTIAK